MRSIILLSVLSVWFLFSARADAQGVIQSGQTLSGNIASAGQTNTLLLQGTTGDRILVTMTITSGTINPYIRLDAPNSGNCEASVYNYDGTPSITLDHQLAQTGTYQMLLTRFVRHRYRRL